MTHQAAITDCVCSLSSLIVTWYCLLIDLNRTVVILILIHAIHPSVCQFSPSRLVCYRVPRSIFHVVEGFIIGLAFYICYKMFTLRRDLHREGQVELP